MAALSRPERADGRVHRRYASLIVIVILPTITLTDMRRADPSNFFVTERSHMLAKCLALADRLTDDAKVPRSALFMCDTCLQHTSTAHLPGARV